MAVFSYVAEAIGSNEFFNVSAEAAFEVLDDLGVVMSKSVNKGESVYYVGEEIVFTITLGRVEGIQGAITRITLTDAIPETVSFDINGVQIVQGIKGQISVDMTNRLVTIENLALDNANPVIVVQIRGIIVEPTL